MADQVVRVALLARAGNARDQLHRALTDLGAELVAEGDPSELNPVAVASLSPSLVIISVEPAIEAALDRFDGLLAMPGVDVMYDDAEVTRELDGWDLNRWARHLAAKLLGRDVMPPPPEGAGVVSMAAATVATAPAAVAMAPSATVEAAPGLSADFPLPSLGLDLDPADLEQAIGRIDAGFSSPAAATAAGTEFSMDVDLASLDGMIGGGHHAEASAPGDSGLSLDMDFDAQPGGFAHFGGGDDVPAAGLDDDVAALAAQLDALAANDRHELPQEPEFARLVPGQDETPKAGSRPPAGDQAVSERRDASATTAKPSFDFSALSLAPMEDGAPAPAAVPVPPPAPKAAAPAPSLGKMNLSLAPMGDDEAAAAPETAPVAASDAPTSAVAALPATDIRGVVLILAGLGGPDAVRQLLKALPAQLPVAVLLYQHLEVGNHDRLVSQLAKVSAWPVYLAGAGMSAAAGQVAVMPQGVAPQADSEGVVFIPGSSQRAMIEGLSASDSLVFLLSGADPEAVPAALALAGKGGGAMGQDPAACFDPAAAQALVTAGGRVGDAAAMAQQLASRWA